MGEAVFVPGSGYLQDDRVLEAIARGVQDAGNPYFDFVFGGTEAASAALREWVRRPSSEVYAGRAQVLVDGDTPVGGFIAMPGVQCRACRMADAAALFSRAKGPDRAALLARIGQTKGLFATIEDGDWYVSKVWVDPAFRGRGYGRLLTRAAFFPTGPGRTVGDMSADNEAALRMYAREGIAVGQPHSSAAGLEYVVLRAERQG